MLLRLSVAKPASSWYTNAVYVTQQGGKVDMRTLVSIPVWHVQHMNTKGDAVESAGHGIGLSILKCDHCTYETKPLKNYSSHLRQKDALKKHCDKCKATKAQTTAQVHAKARATTMQDDKGDGDSSDAYDDPLDEDETFQDDVSPHKT